MVKELADAGIQRVAVVYDRDTAGRAGAATAVKALRGGGLEAVALELPADLGAGGDVDDLHRVVGDGGLAGALAGLQELPAAAPGPSASGKGGSLASESTLPCLAQPDEDKPPPQRDQVYNLARDAGAQPFRSHDGRPFVDLPIKGGGRKTIPLARGGRFSSWLGETYVKSTGRLPSSQALADAMRAVESFAMGDAAPVHRVELRVGGDDGDGLLVVDLGRADGICAVVTSDGWRLGVAPDGVRFERGARGGELPEPTAGAPPVVETLRSILEPVVASEDDLILLVAWLFGAIMPGAGRPHLLLSGEQGSAKTSTAGTLRGFVDPVRAARNAAGETSGAIREARSIPSVAKQNYVLALDNLSYINNEISDVLCRLCTGGSIDDRKLYTDSELASLDVTRPVILTSIVEVVGRPDLLDRTITVETRAPTPRVTDAELHRRIHEAAPLILGGLLNAAAAALRERGDIDHPGDGFRLLGFTQWVRAGAAVLGLDGDTFVDAYANNRARAVANATEGSRLAAELVLLAERPAGWTGTLAQLLDTLNQQVERDDRPKDWPGSGKALANALRRLKPALFAAQGVEILYWPDVTGSNKHRTWTLRTAPSAGADSGADRNCNERYNTGADQGADRGGSGADPPHEAPPRKANSPAHCEREHTSGADGADGSTSDLYAREGVDMCRYVGTRAPDGGEKEESPREAPHPPIRPRNVTDTKVAGVTSIRDWKSGVVE